MSLYSLLSKSLTDQTSPFPLAGTMWVSRLGRRHMGSYCRLAGSHQAYRKTDLLRIKTYFSKIRQVGKGGSGWVACGDGRTHRGHWDFFHRWLTAELSCWDQQWDQGDAVIPPPPPPHTHLHTCLSLPSVHPLLEAGLYTTLINPVMISFFSLSLTLSFCLFHLGRGDWNMEHQERAVLVAGIHSLMSGARRD